MDHKINLLKKRYDNASGRGTVDFCNAEGSVSFHGFGKGEALIQNAVYNKGFLSDAYNDYGKGVLDGSGWVNCTGHDIDENYYRWGP